MEENSVRFRKEKRHPKPKQSIHPAQRRTYSVCMRMEWILYHLFGWWNDNLCGHQWQTGGFSTFIAAVPGVPTAALAIRFPKAWKPAFPVFTSDGLAGAKQVFIFITEDSPMSLQAFTTVWKCIDWQAGTMHTSTGGDKPKRIKRNYLPKWRQSNIGYKYWLWTVFEKM